MLPRSTPKQRRGPGRVVPGNRGPKRPDQSRIGRGGRLGAGVADGFRFGQIVERDRRDGGDVELLPARAGQDESRLAIIPVDGQDLRHGCQLPVVGWSVGGTSLSAAKGVARRRQSRHALRPRLRDVPPDGSPDRRPTVLPLRRRGTRGSSPAQTNAGPSSILAAEGGR